MKLVVYIGVGLLALQMPISAAEINTSKILIEHNKKLNQLKKTNKDLQGQIEVLQQQQKISTEKIQSLFHLLKYKKPTVVSKKLLRAEVSDKAAKKAYTNAKGFLMIGEYDKAIKLFTTYLGLYPNNNHTSDAHYWLAKSYMAKRIITPLRRCLLSSREKTNCIISLPILYTNWLKLMPRLVKMIKQNY